MLTQYAPLKQLDNLDTKGWKIDFNQILTPKRGVSPYIFLIDKFYESNDSKYACLVYTIVEWRMGSYSGLIAIFENKQTPILLANPKNQWFSYEGDKTLYFINDLLFIRKQGYNEDKTFSGTPVMVVALKAKKFGFINFDFTSVYYSPVHVENSIYKFSLDSPNELNSRFPNHDGETFDLTDHQFYRIDQLK